MNRQSAMPRQSDDRAKTVRAILLLISGVVLFAVMDGLSKLLTGDYPVVQLVWARYAFAVPVVLAASGPPAAWPGLLRCERPALQAGRGLLPVLANTTAVLALGLMPLGDATREHGGQYQRDRPGAARTLDSSRHPGMAGGVAAMATAGEPADAHLVMPRE
jgi:hypothetical protein